VVNCECSESNVDEGWLWYVGSRDWLGGVSAESVEVLYCIVFV